MADAPTCPETGKPMVRHTGGPNAFQKYEAGDVTVSKGISNFLRMLERHPEEVEELKKQA